jgi:ribosomal protein S2
LHDTTIKELLEAGAHFGHRSEAAPADEEVLLHKRTGIIS